MLLSHPYKFLFIHVPKVAGNSIERGLRTSTFNRGEMLAWEADLLLRKVGYRMGRKCNLGSPLLLRGSARETRLIEDIFGTKHLKALHVRDHIGTARYNCLFKFGFVRNPWDRHVSLYHYLKGKKHHAIYKSVSNLDFDEYVQWLQKTGTALLQKEKFVDKNGNLIVDFIGRYETLQADFNCICTAIKLPPFTLPHLNRSKRAQRRPYQDYYTGQTRDIIHELEQVDIEYFQYAF